MSTNVILKIGTRGSPLAVAQAVETANALRAVVPELADPDSIEVVIIKTTGDVILDKPLAEVGGKGLFTKEIDDAMLSGQIDLAVHSMKDVPTWLPDGIDLPCMLERQDPRDAFLSPKAKTLADLPSGSVVGTASLRRGAFILSARPDLRIETFRGNVQSRLKKLEDGVVDATLLALAGLRRLGMEHVASSILDMDVMLPAVAQGAIGVTCRTHDDRAQEWLSRINHSATVTAVTCERAFLRILDGSCRTPIGGFAKIIKAEGGDRLEFTGRLARTDGSQIFEAKRLGSISDADALGTDAGKEVKAASGGC